MSSSKIDKSYSEGSDRHLHEPVKTVLHSVPEQRLVNVTTASPRIDELLEHPQKALQRGGNSEILQPMESTIIQTLNQEHKGLAQQEEGDNGVRIPSSFCRASHKQANLTKRGRRRKINGGNQIPPVIGCHGQCLQHGQNLDGI
ncbi:hypothetical protein O181_082605 [Austropuccinia psidii MF-1]|uniref:Uncharacterized protein n=1 Tax=Austropuccinia psidii MF-1 TaxID=1389203 RepID=A0A9Q3IL06_9BASI|nr:hypothetical protein [Austropuccinia psidii MF-1]